MMIARTRIDLSMTNTGLSPNEKYIVDTSENFLSRYSVYVNGQFYPNSLFYSIINDARINKVRCVECGCIFDKEKDYKFCSCEENVFKELYPGEKELYFIFKKKSTEEMIVSAMKDVYGYK